MTIANMITATQRQIKRDGTTNMVNGEIDPRQMHSALGKNTEGCSNKNDDIFVCADTKSGNSTGNDIVRMKNLNKGLIPPERASPKQGE